MKSIAILCLSITGVLSATFSTNCGRSLATQPDWRIVGGTKAAKGEFPWQIQLNRVFYQSGQEMVMSCGGSIINDKWILTAAHCVADSSNAQEYSVLLAIVDLEGSEGYKAGVSQVIHHEHFKMNEQSGYITNDIALVKLDTTINFQKHQDLEPLCLAQQNTQLTSTCIATGYGLLDYDEDTNDGTPATTLQKVSEPLTDNSKCSKLYPYFNATQNVCAGGTARGGTGTCMGDSGGPLQCKANDGKFYQVGIVSYGTPCALANDADVFTKVSNYIDWIEQTIARN